MLNICGFTNRPRIRLVKLEGVPQVIRSGSTVRIDSTATMYFLEVSEVFPSYLA